MVKVTSEQHAKAGCPGPSKARWCSGLVCGRGFETICVSIFSENHVCGIGIRTPATSRDEQTLESIIETLENLPLLTALVAYPTIVEAHVHTILAALLGYRDQQQQQHHI